MDSALNDPPPPALPPKNPLRTRLRAAASLNALTQSASATSDLSGPNSNSGSGTSIAEGTSSPGAGPSHRPPPIIVPPLPPLPRKDSSSHAGLGRSSSVRSLAGERRASTQSQASQNQRRPSTASSVTSVDSSALLTPASVDTSTSTMVSGSITTAAASVTTTGSYEYSTKISSNALAGASGSGISVLSNGTSTGQGAEKTTKRTHALIELLTSERVYASDLAVMRTVYMPLALGQAATLQPPPPTPTNALPIASTYSTATTGSDPSRVPESDPTPIPPMTPEDVRVIFSNTEALGVFADAFVESIEASMGDAALSTGADGGLSAAVAAPNGDGPVVRDSIGALFLQAAPTMKELYVVYITRHPLALSRLSVLTAPTRPVAPVTTKSTPLLPATHGGGGTYTTPQHASSSKFEMDPIMKAYLAKARSIAERYTNAWDLPSLLIKPVQRLLKYPLLLQTLISSTQDSDPTHPDLPNLIEAKRVMEAVARDVNEARRRWETVKSVLDGYGTWAYTADFALSPRGPPVANGDGAAVLGVTNGTTGAVASGKQYAAQSSSSSGLKTFARTINPLSSSTSSSPARHSRPSTAPTGAGAPGSGGGGAGGDDDIMSNPLTRIQSLKTKLKTSLVPPSFATKAAAEEARSATDELLGWEKKLKECEDVLHNTYSNTILVHSRRIRDNLHELLAWHKQYERVTGYARAPDDLAPSGNAVHNFEDVVNRLLHIWADFDREFQHTVYPLLTDILRSTKGPAHLVRHCIALQPLHLQHLNTPYAKSRSPSLLGSSKTFLAVQAQLRLEMPTYFDLFDRSLGGLVVRIYRLSTVFWENYLAQWQEYALRIGLDIGQGVLREVDGEVVLTEPRIDGLSYPQAHLGIVSMREAPEGIEEEVSKFAADLQQHRRLKLAMSCSLGGGVDAAGPDADEDGVRGGSENAINEQGLQAMAELASQIHKRWDQADREIHALTILQHGQVIHQRRPGAKSRVSGASLASSSAGAGATLSDKDHHSLHSHGRDSRGEVARSSTTSSLLASTYEFLNPSSTTSSTHRSSSGGSKPGTDAPSTPPTTATGSGGRSRSGTAMSGTSLAPPQPPSRKNSISTTVTSPTSLHSSTSGDRPPPSPHSPQTRDWASGNHTPTSVNGPPLTPKELERKERKRAEKAEREAAVKLVQERAKAEKAAAKAAGKASRGSTGHSMFAVGGFLPTLMMSSSSHAPPTLSAQDAVQHQERPHKRGSKHSDSSSGKQKHSSAQMSTSTGSAPGNLADRTRDVLFGLMPSAHYDEEIPPPSLPTIHQMSPYNGSLPSSPTMPGAYSMAAAIPHHPYAGYDGRTSGEGSPPIGGENGLWDSLFDASQQSYKFRAQEGSPGTPSPISAFNQEHRNAFGYPTQDVRSASSSASTSTHRPHSHSKSKSKSRSPSRNHHSRSHSVPPQPPPVPSHNQNVRFEEDEGEYQEAPTPPGMYETLYVVSCVHPFHPPLGAMHMNIPFLTLEINDVVDILLEDGHPSTHQGLPIYVDDGDDCMLIGRDERDNIGWCLASFVMPLL